MEPGVPFALLGAVQLLLVGALAGLAAAGLLRRTTAGLLVAVGAVVLGAVEVRTALRLGVPRSDDLVLARAAGALVLASGLLTGGLGPRRRPLTVPAYGVVAPLAATGGPAALAAVASAVAGLAALWDRRDAVGAWLAGALALLAAACAVAPSAGTGSGGPVAVLLLRGAAALALLVALALLAQGSLLSKVVGATLVGVLAMAVAAVGVVGTVVVSSYDRQNRDLVKEARDTRLGALTQIVAPQANQIARFVPQICQQPTTCFRFLDGFASPQADDFVVRVPRSGTPVAVTGRLHGSAAPPSPSEVLGLRSAPVVTAVLAGSGASQAAAPVAGVVRLAGSPPSVAVVSVVAAPRAAGAALPPAVYVYGVRIDDAYAQRDFDTGQSISLSLLAGDPLQVVASNASTRVRRQLLGIVQRSGVVRGLPADGTVLASQGSLPTIALRALTDGSPDDPQTVALLAVSRDPGAALVAERRALQLLVVTSLLALLAVAVAAAVLGRRTVDPVRRLTAAAARVAA
ncbi:MAG: hypothetical protein ACXVGH_08495, partial [Mycobacteriales bacterium]